MASYEGVEVSFWSGVVERRGLLANGEGGCRFPARNATNGKGKEGRGIGSHTDYGLLIISAQDEVGGWFTLIMVAKCEIDTPL